MKRLLLLVLAVVLASSEVVRAAAFQNELDVPGFLELRPSVYTGSTTHGNETYAFVLRLQRGQGFVFRETVTREAKSETQIRTGKWHQIQGNAMLQLSNQSGFYSVLNVGGTGNLYFDWPLPNATYLALTLRPQAGEVLNASDCERSEHLSAEKTTENMSNTGNTSTTGNMSNTGNTSTTGNMSNTGNTSNTGNMNNIENTSHTSGVSITGTTGNMSNTGNTDGANAGTFSYRIAGILRFVHAEPSGNTQQSETSKKSERAGKRKRTESSEKSGQASVQASLEDRESSLLHRISGAKLLALRTQYEGHPVFVEVEVRETDELARAVGESPALHLQQVFRVTDVLPKPTQGTSNLFRDAVAGEVWESFEKTAAGENVFRRFTFVPGKDTRTGLLDFFDGTQSVQIPYTLSEDGLVFAKAAVNGLRAVGHEQTAERLTQVRRWQVEGQVLELRDKSHVVDILEKRKF